MPGAGFLFPVPPTHPPAELQPLPAITAQPEKQFDVIGYHVSIVNFGYVMGKEKEVSMYNSSKSALAGGSSLSYGTAYCIIQTFACCSLGSEAYCNEDKDQH